MAKADMEKFRKLQSARAETKSRRQSAMGYAALKVKNGDNAKADIAEAEEASDALEERDQELKEFTLDYVEAHRGEFKSLEKLGREGCFSVLAEARQSGQADAAILAEMWILYRFQPRPVRGALAAIKRASEFTTPKEGSN